MKPDSSQPVSTSVGPMTAVAANEPAAGDVFERQISVGDLLRAGREKAGLSHGDIASRLRMGIKQVRALEESDYSALPKGTFLRGFVRNFAKEVGVASEDVLRLLEATHKEATAVSASAVLMPSRQNISVPTPGGEISSPRMRVFFAFAIASLLLAVVWYWWEYVRPHRADGGRPKVVAEEKVAETTPVSAPRVSADNVVSESPAGVQEKEIVVPASPRRSLDSPLSPPGGVPEAAIASPAAPVIATPDRPEVSSPPRPVQPVGSGLLGFTFTDRSWVEVTDGSGKIVLDRTFRGGEANELAGRAPFSVVIGNALATRMAYNGKEIDLAPHTRASVARLTVK